MTQYRFVTIWRLQAPIERIFAEIDAIEAWPEWWPNVRRVEKREAGDADGIGAPFATTFVGRLPYQLRFDLRVTRREPPTSVVGDATGELEGVVSGRYGKRAAGRWSATCGRSGPRPPG